ncbi:MAG: hypothetical protein ABI131_06380 [Nostocoides sp.]
MEWEGLFADLEAQWEAQERRELDAEVADRTRRERALVDLTARLAAHRTGSVTLRLRAGDPLTGVIVDVGDGWLAMTRPRGSTLVALAAVVGVEGLTSRSQEAAAARRFGLGHALRGLSRDRATVTVLDVAGGQTTGTIDAVGSDHLEISLHHGDEPRREPNVRSRRAIPFAAVVSVSIA